MGARLGRFVFSSVIAPEDPANGKLVATPSGSGVFGYQHYWYKYLRSSLSYGYLRINNTAADPVTIKRCDLELRTARKFAKQRAVVEADIAVR